MRIYYEYFDPANRNKVQMTTTAVVDYCFFYTCNQIEAKEFFI